MELHFGKGVHTCPCAGKMAPEVVGGYLDQIFEEAWKDIEPKLRQLCRLPGSNNTTIAEWKIILGDLGLGQAALMSLLRVKLDFYSHSPWMLVALALDDET